MLWLLSLRQVDCNQGRDGVSGLRLGDFVGDWRIGRQITDRLGPEARLEGRAEFAEVAGGLEYLETGQLRVGDLAAMNASRRYRWRAEGPAIAVEFPDGRAFHRFDPGRDQPEATHDCAPDTYHVRYDFTRWPDWTCHWRVTGPRKDYDMLTRYSRA